MANVSENEKVVRTFDITGLSEDEYGMIVALLGRSSTTGECTLDTYPLYAALESANPVVANKYSANIDVDKYYGVLTVSKEG